MAETLIEYWRRFKTRESELNLHPDDRAWLETKKSPVLKQDLLRKYPDYVSSKRFDCSDKELHLSLLPVPFVGDLQSAKIFVFLQNPGFGHNDYFLEQQDRFRETSIKNIAQESDPDYPFFYLNPEFAWSFAFEWWEGKFRPIIMKLMSEGRTYRQALQFLSKRVAAVELFPYHSADSAALSKIGRWHEMPSVIKAQQFLEDAYPRTDVLKLIMRSHAHWNRGGRFVDANHFHLGPKTRGFTFNCEVAADAKIAGTKILKFLENS